MDELQLYEQILSLDPPWTVVSVVLDDTATSVSVSIEYDPDAEIHCPHCNKLCPRYDSRTRKWRHLDTCQYQTYVHASIPRVECDQHGISQIAVPWAEQNTRFTALFEAKVIDWLHESSINAVARRFGLSWNAIDGIMQRAVKRGIRRQKRTKIEHISVDEIAIKKGHHYVTVISNEHGCVLDVENNRRKESLAAFYLKLEGKTSDLKTISMDMSGAYISATKAHVEQWEDVICFDRFHVMQDLNNAVNTVRKMEVRNLTQEIRKTLHLSKFSWLRSESTLSLQHRAQIDSLSKVAKKTARAWSIKQYAGDLWAYSSRTWARKAWRKWYGWAIRSRLAPIKTCAKSIKKNLWGIINAIVYKKNNARAEAINGKIKNLKLRSKGFANMERFKTAILFNFGGLKLYP